MRLKFILVTAGLFIFAALYGQEESPSNGFPLRISYFGDNLKNPGMRIGSSHTLHRKVKLKTRRSKSLDKVKKSKTKVIKYLLDANIGFYNQPNNHFGIPVGIGITRLRNVNSRRLSTGLSFEVNYLQRIYNIDTYILNEDGDIEELNAAGNGGLAFTLAPLLEIAVGKKDLPIFIKPMIQLNKYNHTFAINYAAEFGITLNLSKS